MDSMQIGAFAMEFHAELRTNNSFDHAVRRPLFLQPQFFLADRELGKAGVWCPLGLVNTYLPDGWSVPVSTHELLNFLPCLDFSGCWSDFGFDRYDRSRGRAGLGTALTSYR